MARYDPENMPPEFQAVPIEKNPSQSGNLRFLVDVLETLLLAGIMFLGIHLVTARIRVDGESMLPSLRPGEFIVVNRLAYKFDDPARGDVIVFRFPRDPEQEFIKRVIGLPGDRVRISRGTVFINDIALAEDYINAPAGYQGEWVVPEGGIFVMGDNRNNSSDSRDWGSVPFEDIIGKAVFVYWPPEMWGVVEHPVFASAGG